MTADASEGGGRTLQRAGRAGGRVGDRATAEVIDPDVDLHVPAQRAETAGGRAWHVLAAISAGGALGALGRYGLERLWPAADAAGFPYGVFLANAVGCALIGVLMVLLGERDTPASPLLRPFLGVGVLGGFTSFSAYAIDIVRLLEQGVAGPAAAYLAGTLCTALAAVWATATGTRALLRRREARSGPGRGTDRSSHGSGRGTRRTRGTPGSGTDGRAEQADAGSPGAGNATGAVHSQEGPEKDSRERPEERPEERPRERPEEHSGGNFDENAGEQRS